MNRKFTKEIKITTDAIINAIKELTQKHKKIENIKIRKVSMKEIGEILEMIEIENLGVSLKVGTPFIPSSISLVIILSTLIPVIYEKTDNRNGNLFYNVEPNFSKFEFVGEINLNFKITVMKILMIICYLKKKNNKKIKRRSRDEQSSYRRFNEYSYE